jgi:hypothetical protein
VNAQLARGLQAQVTVHDLAVAAGEHRRPSGRWAKSGRAGSGPWLPAKACLTFRYVKSGGAFRRVRFALACRTEPLIQIYSYNNSLYKCFLSDILDTLVVNRKRMISGMALARCTEPQL